MNRLSKAALSCFFITILRVLESVSGLCSNIPSGLNRMGNGVDISILDIEPIIQKDQPSGFKVPIFDRTCNEEKQWINPYNDLTYQQPDQILSIQSVSSGTSDAYTEVFQTREEVRESFALSVGLGLGVEELLAFSSSPSYRLITSAISVENKKISEVSIEVTTTEAFHVEDLKLSGPVQSKIDNLPTSFQDNSSAYEEFINTYGTHYFKMARFGGRIMTYFETESTYLISHTTEQLENQAKIEFINKLDTEFNADVSSDVEEIDEEFTSRTEERTVYYGGTTNLLESEGFSQWQPTVPTNPWILGGRLAPISDLIIDANRKAGMEQATIVHMDMSVLDELDEILEQTLRKYQSAGRNTRLVENFKEGVAIEKAKMLPDHDTVQELQTNVAYHYTIPAWWNDVSVCFEVNVNADFSSTCPDDSVSRCGKRETYTDAFDESPDNADSRCTYSWGVFSPSQTDGWFNAMELCLKKVGDCEGDNEICALFNSFLHSDLTQITNSDEHCRLIWKVKSKSQGLPEWSDDIVFCFSLQAENQDGNRLCAELNSWTGDYFEFLEDRNYGLRWGLFKDHWPSIFLANDNSSANNRSTLTIILYYVVPSIAGVLLLAAIIAVIIFVFNKCRKHEDAQDAGNHSAGAAENIGLDHLSSNNQSPVDRMIQGLDKFDGVGRGRNANGEFEWAIRYRSQQGTTGRAIED